jgi:hypothetical protein
MAFIADAAMTVVKSLGRREAPLALPPRLASNRAPAPPAVQSDMTGLARKGWPPRLGLGVLCGVRIEGGGIPERLSLPFPFFFRFVDA